MNAYLAEFVGTAILVLLGDGVVANVLLAKTKGHGAGWIVITAGWGFAVFVAVGCTNEFSGAHLNPAVTIALAAAGKFKGGVLGYIVCQMLGAMLGAALVYLLYKNHFDATDDKNAKLGVFCTAPAISNRLLNSLCEIVGTFVLVLAVLIASDWGPSFQLDASADAPKIKVGLGSIGALQVGLIVFAIGLSLGGPTGYAINPARDLGPRLVHWLLPIANKRDSDWTYAAIPAVAPIVGGLLAAMLYLSAIK
jgi:glycerol uptake facilitator protein